MRGPAQLGVCFEHSGEREGGGSYLTLPSLVWGKRGEDDGNGGSSGGG